MQSIREYYDYRPSASQSFGAPRDGGRRSHRGLDISHSTRPGTPVPALLGGVVVGRRVPSTYHGFGYQVTVESRYEGETVQLSYAHGDGPTRFREGDRVAAGDTVLHEGTTGATNGPCVHIELFVGGVFKDPAPFIQRIIDIDWEDDMIICIKGKTGVRRGGLYLVQNGSATFIGARSTSGYPMFTDEKEIAILQSKIENLR